MCFIMKKSLLSQLKNRRIKLGLKTSVYIEDERKYALKLGKTKGWYAVTASNFQSWTDRADIPWRAIKPHLDDTVDKARTLRPDALKHLPMDEAHLKKG